MSKNKMNWFLDAYLNDSLDDKIEKCGHNKANIVLPTGGGKSGLVYTNILNTMIHVMNSGSSQKIVFNISAPYLKLEAQLLNDFIKVVREIFTKAGDKIKFYINSSSSGDAFKKEFGSIWDAKRFDEIDMFFEPSEPAQFAIVASCHKSLKHFAAKLDYLRQNATVYTYLDEAHLLASDIETFERIVQKDETCNTAKNVNEQYGILEKLCESNRIYAITATPDKKVVEIINKANGTPIDFIAVNVYAKELIDKNIILPVDVYVEAEECADESNLTPEVCISFMNKVKAKNPDIKHKILVNCSDSKHLNNLKTELEKTHKVFSTCCAYGTRTNGDEEIEDAEFIEILDNYDDDCFVLHIKQLTQGIDVNTLTDCIIYNSSTLEDYIKRRLIQTIGRTIRPLAGERGVDITNRKKKCGNVMFLVGGTKYNALCDQIESFILNYYGRTGMHLFESNSGVGTRSPINGTLGPRLANSGLGKGYNGVNDIQFLIDELKIDMQKYIMREIIPQWKRHCIIAKKTNRKVNRKILNSELATMKEKYKYFKGMYNTCELLSDSEFMNEANKFIEDATNNIENYIERMVK